LLSGLAKWLHFNFKICLQQEEVADRSVARNLNSFVCFRAVRLQVFHTGVNAMKYNFENLFNLKGFFSCFQAEPFKT
jgi:hypothetical protein